MPAFTNQNLVHVFETVMGKKREGVSYFLWPGLSDYKGGWDFTDKKAHCQMAARKGYACGTGGLVMPGADATAWQTHLNLDQLADQGAVEKITDLDKLVAGDAMYFRCMMGGKNVGHVIYYWTQGKAFQDTSRAGLGITDEMPTEEQLSRFVGAYRFFDIEPDRLSGYATGNCTIETPFGNVPGWFDREAWVAIKPLAELVGLRTLDLIRQSRSVIVFEPGAAEHMPDVPDTDTPYQSGPVSVQRFGTSVIVPAWFSDHTTLTARNAALVFGWPNVYDRMQERRAVVLQP